jgi:hypothetical protein
LDTMFPLVNDDVTAISAVTGLENELCSVHLGS